MTENQTYRAVVEKVVKTGRHGPYVVTKVKDLEGSVTFALKESTWTETDEPEPGMEVILSRLRKKQAGWRALSARYVNPTDEQQQETK